MGFDGRKDKSDLFKRLTADEKTDFSLEEARTMEALWKKRRIALELKR